MYSDNILAYMNESEKRGDYIRAIELYHIEIDKNPSEILYYRICFCAFELYRKDQYNEYYYRFLQQFPEISLISWYLTIFHYFFEGNIREIWRIFDEIQDQELRPSEMYCLEMGILLYEGRYQKCISVGEKARNLYPHDWAISYYSASVLFRIGSYLPALKIIEDIDVWEFPYILDLKIRIVSRLGIWYEKVLAELRGILYSLNAPKIDYNAIGNCYYTLHEYTRAIAFYTYTMKAVPHDNYAYNGIGNCYLALWKYQTARSVYAQGLKNMHGIYTNYSLVGIAKSYMLEKNYGAADSVFQTIFAKQWKNPYLLFEAAKNMHLGDKVSQTTLVYLDEVLLLNPHYGAAKRLKKKVLQKIGHNFL